MSIRGIKWLKEAILQLAIGMVIAIAFVIIFNPPAATNTVDIIKTLVSAIWFIVLSLIFLFGGIYLEENQIRWLGIQWGKRSQDLGLAGVVTASTVFVQSKSYLLIYASYAVGVLLFFVILCELLIRKSESEYPKKD